MLLVADRRPRATSPSTVVLLLLFVFLSTNVAVLVLRRDTVDHAALPDAGRAFPVLAIVVVPACC